MATAYIIDNRPRDIDWSLRGATVDRKLQNARNLMRLHMGEVPYDRLRGIDMQLYHMSINDMQEELLPELDRVLLWEPFVDVAEATVALDENGDSIIEATVEIDLEQLARSELSQ